MGPEQSGLMNGILSMAGQLELVDLKVSSFPKTFYNSILLSVVAWVPTALSSILMKFQQELNNKIDFCACPSLGSSTFCSD